MQTKDKEFRRPLTRVALVVSCIVGIVVFINWIPTSIGGPTAIVAPTALPPGVARRIGGETAPPAIRSSKARCPDCGVIESAREVTKTNETSGNAQCTDRDNSAAVVPDSHERAENADLAILLEWHMNARNAYSFLRRETDCATLAAIAAPFRAELEQSL